jgi:hypothetical protein
LSAAQQERPTTNTFNATLKLAASCRFVKRFFVRSAYGDIPCDIAQGESATRLITRVITVNAQDARNRCWPIASVC